MWYQYVVVALLTLHCTRVVVDAEHHDMGVAITQSIIGIVPVTALVICLHLGHFW
jgi:hypothetical protein